MAKWLDTNLKPLSLNRYTVTDIFEFANEIRSLKIASGDILVSYDVSSLFTNVPLDETIQLLANRAFTNNWFNTTYDLNLTKMDLVDLLSVVTKGQLFQFNGALYEQTDGVAMGSPLGPLLANVFMSHIEENLEREGKLPSFYRRYVDDTLTIMSNIGITQPFWETRDRRLDKKTSTIHDLNHTGKKTNRGSSGLDSEYLVFVPHVKEVGLGHSCQIQFRWISHLPTLNKRTHIHSTFDPVCFKNEGD